MTFLEVLVVIVVMGIIANIGLDAITAADANFRADRAARETLAALRYARWLAMTTGNLSGVEFNTSKKTIQVYTVLSSTNTWVVNPFSKANTYLIDLVNNSEVANVAMTVNLPSDTTNPYDCVFNQLGATTNTGTIVFTYGQQGKRTVTIPAVDDPTLN